MRLHEIEIHAADPQASKRFYHDLLGLPIQVDQEGLKVFDSGLPGLDLNASKHFPGRASLAFLVKDLDQVVERLRAKGLQIADPHGTHLGMRAIELQDPDGNRIAIHAPSEQSPDWLKALV